jgi:DNA-binding MarR family transcriptional regulator
MPTSTSLRLDDADYVQLLELRSGLRRFLRWSEEEARRAGLSPAQHQLLLAVRGHVPGNPTIGDLADHLLLRRHSATELVDRAAAAGLVSRLPDPDDHRVVHVRLTAAGLDRLERLTVPHLEELRRLAKRIGPIISGLERADTHAPSSSEPGERLGPQPGATLART